MASAVREISSVSALASLDPRVTPPNVTAIPAINCLRVGLFVNALKLFLSLIFVLRLSSRDRNASDYPLQNMFKIIFSGPRYPPSRHTSAPPTRSPHALSLWTSPGSQEGHHR